MIKLLVLLASLVSVTSACAELWIPAFTAYLDSPGGGARISRDGIASWTDPRITTSWYGEIKTPGKIMAALSVRVPEGAEARFKLTVGDESLTAHVQGTGTTIRVSFGEYHLKKAGYTRFQLTSLNPAGTSPGDVDALVLDGPASQGAHFNLEQRRNAPSVSLHYAVPRDTTISLFYNEVVVVTDPVDTSYKVVVFDQGYFGLQVLSPTVRRIIFAVWDMGVARPAKERTGGAGENRVRLLAMGEGVEANEMGQEITGGKARLVYPWVTGQVQKFVVTARADGTHTDFTGYWFHPERRQWQLVASYRVPQEDGWLRNLHSLSENVDGANGHLPRQVLFGPQWARAIDGQWHELTTARFSHDGTGQDARLDRFTGIDRGQFILSTGGFVTGFTKDGTVMTRPSTNRPPVVQLPELPTPSMRP